MDMFKNDVFFLVFRIITLLRSMCISKHNQTWVEFHILTDSKSTYENLAIDIIPLEYTLEKTKNFQDYIVDVELWTVLSFQKFRRPIKDARVQVPLLF